MRDDDKHFVPALRFHRLTTLFDPAVALTTRERTFKHSLIVQADISRNHHVLDVGCGTGTLAIWIKRQQPEAEVVGLDADPRILDLAQQKTQQAGVTVAYDQAFSTDMPYTDSTFDRIVSTLFFHHLDREYKMVTMQEMYRVLKPGGEIHIADWGKPKTRPMRAMSLPVRILDGFENTRDNIQGKLPELFEENGFENVESRNDLPTMFGTLTLYSGEKPLT